MADGNTDTATLTQDTDTAGSSGGKAPETTGPTAAELKAQLESVQARLAEANAESAQRRRKLKPFEELGTTPEEIAELLQQQRDAEAKAAEDRGEWEKLRTTLKENHATELRSREERIEKLEQRLDSREITGQLMEAADTHDAFPKLLPTHASQFIKMEEVDGVRAPVVVDEKGNRRLGADGEYMTIDGLVAWMREQEEFWPLFKGQGVAGGGASGHDGAGRAPTGKKATDMSVSEKMDFIDEHGAIAWAEKLRADRPSPS